MPKISEYALASKLAPDDLFVVETAAGTRAVKASNVGNGKGGSSGGSAPKQREPKNLGSSITPEQKQDIQWGIFEDIFPGDYWQVSSIRYYVVDRDYLYFPGANNSRVKNTPKHHIVVMPDISGMVPAMFDRNYGPMELMTSGKAGTPKALLKTLKKTLEAFFGAESVIAGVYTNMNDDVSNSSFGVSIVSFYQILGAFAGRACGLAQQFEWFRENPANINKICPEKMLVWGETTVNGKPACVAIDRLGVTPIPDVSSDAPYLGVYGMIGY